MAAKKKTGNIRGAAKRVMKGATPIQKSSDEKVSRKAAGDRRPSKKVVLKTRPGGGSVVEFLEKQNDPQRRAEGLRLLEMFERITGEGAKLWGPSIVGFGSYEYHYESGRRGEWFFAGFSPRKQNLTVYLMDGLERHVENLEKLGPHKTGKSCLYLGSLSAIRFDVLEAMILACVRRLQRRK